MSIPIDVRIETIIALLEANEPSVKPALQELYHLRLQSRAREKKLDGLRKKFRPQGRGKKEKLNG